MYPTRLGGSMEGEVKMVGDIGSFVFVWVAIKDLILMPTFLICGILYFMRKA
jgi:hypothetical protein